MAVLLAVLTPSLLAHVESSRAQKDEFAMDEVVNAVKLALSDSGAYDEMLRYSCDNNYITYTDSSGSYGKRVNDGEYWAPDGSDKATTITFNPQKNGNKTKYTMDTAIVNDMTYGNGSTAGEQRSMIGAKIESNQCYLKNASAKADKKTAYVYHQIKQVIGDSIDITSQTYRNSSFTIFIKWDQVDGVAVPNVYGYFNGTNLSEDSLASRGSGTSSYDNDGEAITRPTPGGTTNAVYDSSDFVGGGSVSVTPDYKSGPLITTNQKLSENINLPTVVGNDTWDLSGNVTDDDGVDILTVNDETVAVNSNGDWSIVLKLTKGETKEIVVSATNKQGKTTTKCWYVTYLDEVTDIILTSEYFDDIGYDNTVTNLEIPSVFKGLDGNGYRVVAIGGGVFQYHSNLNSVIVPYSVTEIRKCAFGYCTGLTSVAFEEDSQLTKIGEQSFYECANMINITFPDKLSEIDFQAFGGCTSLANISIPDSVQSIGQSAFRNCVNAKSLSFGKNCQLETIDANVFDKCRSLVSVTIPDSVKVIGYESFLECTNLTHVIFGENSQLTTIEGRAFADCIKLIGISIPNSVTAIGASFSGCTSLTSVMIGEDSKLANIGYAAFYNCTSLSNIYIPASVTNINGYAFMNCPINEVFIDDLKAWCNISMGGDRPLLRGSKLYLHGELVTNLSIPEGITSINPYAFDGCISITSLTIPSGVTNIGLAAFRNCKNLTEVFIPNTVTAIGNYAFQGCTSLSVITFGGFVEDWKDITFGDWRAYVPASKVVCSDGDVNLLS